MKNEREYVREKYSFSVNLISDNYSENCQLIDISLGGCKVTASHKIEKGGRVKILIKNFGEVDGEIVWNYRNNMGIHFINDTDMISELLLGLATYGPN